MNPKAKIIVTLCDPVVRMLNHIDRSSKESKNWQRRTKLNHFETFGFPINPILGIIYHELNPELQDLAEQNFSTEEKKKKIKKMLHYAEITNGKLTRQVT